MERLHSWDPFLDDERGGNGILRNLFTIRGLRAIIRDEMNRQSRNMRVKCHSDGELPVDEKKFLAVHISHPAAAHRQIYQFDIRIPSVSSLRITAKEVFFYETIKTAVCRLLA